MLPPAWFLLSLITAAALHWLVPGPRLLASPYTLVGVLFIVGGLVLIIAPARAFDGAKTAINPFGQPTVFLVEGWYRLTRNPMYLGMVLAYAGIAILCNSLVTLLLLAPLFVWITREVIEREEAYLATKFGAPYLAYKTETRRWF